MVDPSETRASRGARIGRGAGLLAAGLGLGVGAVAAFTGWTLNGRRRPWPEYTFSPFEVGAPSEDLSFESSDGVELAGWWLDVPDSPVVVICAHGHRGNKSEMLGIGSGLWRHGHSVLLFDFRGNGHSGDGPQSLAHHEQRDLSAAVGLVKTRRPDAAVVVVSFSMGASTAILTAADDDRIDALVLDSPFATMRDVVAAGYRRYRLPSEPILPAADLLNRLRYGYAFADVRPLDRIEDLAPRPILLLHGTRDRIIPYDHALQIAAAADPGSLELITFEGVDHCGGYFEDRPGYIQLVAEFIKRSVPAAAG